MEGSGTSDLVAEPINLNDLCVLGIELLIGEIRSQHEQRIAVHHRVVAGRKAKKSGHPHVKRVVVLDKFLAPQRMDNRRLQPLGHCNQFRVSTLATRAAKNGHLARGVKNFSGIAKFVVRWKEERG